MKTQKQARKPRKQPEPTPQELEEIEHDWMVEMLGEEDAAYFELAGIDDIGDK